MIKNLLFDLGGVIMNIRKERCVEAFASLGLADAWSYFGEFSQQGPFMALERGDLDVDGFHAALRRNLPSGTTDDAMDEAFCRFLMGIPVVRLRGLEALHGRYGVYLLSNTNPIMWERTIRTEFEKDGHDRSFYFDGIVTSFEANSLKPEEKIFRHASEKLGIKPVETLFLDDSQANLDSASRLGFRTALVGEGMEFMDILKTSGLI